MYQLTWICLQGCTTLALIWECFSMWRRSSPRKQSLWPLSPTPEQAIVFLFLKMCMSYICMFEYYEACVWIFTNQILVVFLLGFKCRVYLGMGLLHQTVSWCLTIWAIAECVKAAVPFDILTGLVLLQSWLSYHLQSWLPVWAPESWWFISYSDPC